MMTIAEVSEKFNLSHDTLMPIAWFVGLGLTDRVPDHSTLSLNRKRLQESDVVQEIFDHIAFKAIEHRMVAGNVHDSKPYLDRLEMQIKKFGFEQSLEAVTLDAGYFTAAICKELHKRNIYAVIGGRSYTPVKGLIAKCRLSTMLNAIAILAHRSMSWLIRQQTGKAAPLTVDR